MSGIIGDNIGRGTGLIKAAGGGGKILQCLTYADASSRQTNDTSAWVTASNTMGGDITCSATSSKVLVMVHTNTYTNVGDATLTVFRDSTNLGSSSEGLGKYNVAIYTTSFSIIYTDSPSSTSALTYQVKLKQIGSSGWNIINSCGGGRLVLMEIGA